MEHRNTGKTVSPASRLATPTDLEPAEVRAVVEAVNPLIADAVALYLKTKNYHWHLSGPRFREYHLLFDEQAEAILASVDVLAERVRKIGGTTIRGVSHVSELRTIADDNDDFVPAGEMVRRLLENNRRMAERQRAAISVCEENRDTPTGNVLQEILDETERRVWFLYEISQRDESPGSPAGGNDHHRRAREAQYSDWSLYAIPEAGEDPSPRA
ncbi:Ferritin and Dps [Rubrobacter xylanophilus DSM 9941]|uniref:Ferritin and Dps n=1 Tax=Rubrobacter xylanophilus (strain DSM 9941 / JCM 11954 / NBRC 16129 / PRD-1) TaxID=266117 RepID=Q1AV07_RUBXD|nr:DNA starvation/stationary phase protection protein [Rubrobacter xylanophilus]ABG04771.1 Ferritin and Dps [Rubrobacter xylanophilus DSM 9941]